MSRYCAECATAETSSVNVHTELNHFVSRYHLALVFGVWLSCVRQIVSRIYLRRTHCRVGRVHHDVLSVYFLQYALSVFFVRFLFNVSEVFRLKLLVVQAFFVRVQHNVVSLDTFWYICFLAKIGYLWYFLDVLNVSATL